MDMRARAVLLRGGLGAAILTLCVLLVMGLFGEEDSTPLPEFPLAADTAPRPATPSWPDPPKTLPPSLTKPTDTPQIPSDDQKAIAERLRQLRDKRPTPSPPIAIVGYEEIAPQKPTAPVAPPGPLAPPKPTAPTNAVVTAGPVVPATPVIPAASHVAGAPAAPVVPAVPLPTIAALPSAPPAPSAPNMPGVPMPISPAAYAPGNLPASLAKPSEPLAPQAPVAPPAVRETREPQAATHPIHITPPTAPAALPTSPQVPLPPPIDLATITPVGGRQLRDDAPPDRLPPVNPVPDRAPSVVPTPDPLANIPGPASQPGTFHPPILDLPPQFVPTGPGADGTSFNDPWRRGLRFESPDQALSLFVGGMTQFDVVGYLATNGMRQSITGTNALEDGVAFRRLRLDAGGTLYRNVEFYTQLDFSNGLLTTPDSNRLDNAIYPADAWVQFTDLPFLGTLRVGNQKPLYSFEHLTDGRFLNFMERSLGFDAFVENFNNGFAPGISLRNTYWNQRGTWGVGLFKNTRSPFAWNVGRNEAEVNGRLTFLPIYADDGKYLLHVGVGGAHRDLDDDQIRNRARLDARNSPSAFSPLVADTGLYFGTSQQMVIPELVMVAGPWTFQSEYYASWVQNAALAGPDGLRGARQGTIYMQSVYGEVLLFLTGEHRVYDKASGAFTRVVPKRPLQWSRCGFTGCGAWQLAARYSYLDLNDKGINGGRVHDMTIGLNWFLNPNMKVQWNYFLAHRNVADPAGDGFIQGFATRLAIDF